MMGKTTANSVGTTTTNTQQSKNLSSMVPNGRFEEEFRQPMHQDCEQEQYHQQQQQVHRHRQPQQQDLDQQYQERWNSSKNVCDYNDHQRRQQNAYDDDYDYDHPPRHNGEGVIVNGHRGDDDGDDNHHQPTEEVFERMISRSSSTTFDNCSSSTGANYLYNCHQYTDHYHNHNTNNNNYSLPHYTDNSNSGGGGGDSSTQSSYQSKGETTSESESSTKSNSTTSSRRQQRRLSSKAASRNRGGSSKNNNNDDNNNHGIGVCITTRRSKKLTTHIATLSSSSSSLTGSSTSDHVVAALIDDDIIRNNANLKPLHRNNNNSQTTSDDVITNNTLKLLDAVKALNESKKNRRQKQQQSSAGSVTSSIASSINDEKVSICTEQHLKDNDSMTLIPSDTSVEFHWENTDDRVVEGVNVNESHSPGKRSPRRGKRVQLANNHEPSFLPLSGSISGQHDHQNQQRQLQLRHQFKSVSSKSSRSLISESSVDEAVQEAFAHLKARAQRFSETKQRTSALLEISSAYPKDIAEQRQLIETLVTSSTRRKLFNKLARISSRTLSEHSHRSKGNTIATNSFSSKSASKQYNVPNSSTGRNDVSDNEDNDDETSFDAGSNDNDVDIDLVLDMERKLYEERKMEGSSRQLQMQYDDDNDEEQQENIRLTGDEEEEEGDGFLAFDHGYNLNKLLSTSPPLTPTGDTITDHLVREALADWQARSLRSLEVRETFRKSQEFQHQQIQQEQPLNELNQHETQGSQQEDVQKENGCIESSSSPVDQRRSTRRMPLLPPEYDYNDGSDASSCIKRSHRLNRRQPLKQQQQESIAVTDVKKEIVFVPSDEEDEEDDENNEKYDSFAVTNQKQDDTTNSRDDEQLQNVAEGDVGQSNRHMKGTTTPSKKQFVSSSVFQLDTRSSHSSNSNEYSRRPSVNSTTSNQSQNEAHRSSKSGYVSESSSACSFPRRGGKKKRISNASKSSFGDVVKIYVADSTSTTSVSHSTTVAEATIATVDAVVPTIGTKGGSSTTAPLSSIQGDVDQHEICFVPSMEESIADSAVETKSLRLREVLSESLEYFDTDSHNQEIAARKKRIVEHRKRFSIRTSSKILLRSNKQERGTGVRDWLANAASSFKTTTNSRNNHDTTDIHAINDQQQHDINTSAKSFLFRSSRSQQLPRSVTSSPRNSPLQSNRINRKLLAQKSLELFTSEGGDKNINQQQRVVQSEEFVVSNNNKATIADCKKGAFRMVTSTRKMNIQKLKKQQSVSMNAKDENALLHSPTKTTMQFSPPGKSSSRMISKSPGKKMISSSPGKKKNIFPVCHGIEDQEVVCPLPVMK